MVTLVKNKLKFGTITVIVLSILSIFLLGFKLVSNRTPQEVYAVYLNGKKIGVVKSKTELDNYINKQEETLKEKYKVSKIYTPKGVEIKKIITYDDKFDSNESIYQLLVKEQNFTIKGIVIEINPTGDTKNDSEKTELDELVTDGNKKNTKKEIINVISKDIFDESVVDVVKAFVEEKDYNLFMEGNQPQIVDTGELIESIYINNNITYKEGYISTNQKIFTDKAELTKYLLYGSTKDQTFYTVKEGDSIESIATAHKLNTQEFLIANPEFTSVNNLLYESQRVVVDLINPLIDIVVEKHSVKEEVSKFATEVKYDNELVVGYSYTEREGENGLDKVTRKYQYINGQLVDVASLGSVEIKPSVSKIIVKGSKYVPSVADISNWAWPTNKPYTITSGFAYRWGSFHDAIDISLTWGSPIYAANNGTVYGIGTGCIRGDLNCNGGRGNYVIINHNISNYYTIYMHMSSVSVKPGQTVSRGQRIGAMGNTGNVYPVPPYGSNSFAGTHLHFGVFHGIPGAGGRAINPLNLY